MLLAEFLGAVAPAAGSDAGGDARLDARGVHRDRRAKALAIDRDAILDDLGARLQIAQGVARVLHLLEADHSPALTLALAAAAHVEAQRDVAERGEQLRRRARGAAVLVAAEAVQHHECRPALVGFHIGREMEDAGELQAGAGKVHALFHRASIN